MTHNRKIILSAADRIRGNHLSNTTCLTHVFFKVVNTPANETSCIRLLSVIFGDPPGHGRQ